MNAPRINRRARARIDQASALDGAHRLCREPMATIDWMAQTVHRGHHDGPWESCPKNTCDAALRALGRR